MKPSAFVRRFILYRTRDRLKDSRATLYRFICTCLQFALPDRAKHVHIEGRPFLEAPIDHGSQSHYPRSLHWMIHIILCQDTPQIEMKVSIVLQLWGSRFKLYTYLYPILLWTVKWMLFCAPNMGSSLTAYWNMFTTHSLLYLWFLRWFWYVNFFLPWFWYVNVLMWLVYGILLGFG